MFYPRAGWYSTPLSERYPRAQYIILMYCARGDPTANCQWYPIGIRRIFLKNACVMLAEGLRLKWLSEKEKAAPAPKFGDGRAETALKSKDNGGNPLFLGSKLDTARSYACRVLCNFTRFCATVQRENCKRGSPLLSTENAPRHPAPWGVFCLSL